MNYSGNNRISVCLKAVDDAQWNPKLRDLSFDMERNHMYSFAQCFYGWDWGSHAVPTGIWMKYTGTVLVDNPFVLTELAPYYQRPATLNIEYKVKNISNNPVKVKVEGTVTGLTINEVAGRFNGGERVCKIGSCKIRCGGSN